MNGHAPGSDLTADRRIAVLVGLAVGDALGAGTEFQTPDGIAKRYGKVDGYIQGANPGFAPGEFTDDTHMTLCSLGAYWDARSGETPLVDAALRRFQEWRDHRPPDIGNATQRALIASRRHGLAGGFVEWEESGYVSAGNGALMRAAASVIAGSRGEALCREAVELAMLTHPDPRSLGACWLLVTAMEAILDGSPPDDAWRSAASETRPRLSQPVDACFGRHRSAPIAARVAEAHSMLKQAVERGLSGEWRSQSGYVVDTLEAVVAASLAPTFLDGILPVVARGDDSDTVAAIAGAVLGARGLLPPPTLIEGLRCRFAWPTWPTGHDNAWPALAAFVPPPLDAPATSSIDHDEEAVATYARLPTLPPFELDAIGPGLFAGPAPLFRRDVWQLRELGVTHILDLRDVHEWGGSRRGVAAVDEIERLGLNRLVVAVPDMSAPRDGDLDRAAGYIEAALHLGGTVYVHCRAGQQRTAAVLVGWSARTRQCSTVEALADLRKRRPLLAPLPEQLAAVDVWLRRRNS